MAKVTRAAGEKRVYVVPIKETIPAIDCATIRVTEMTPADWEEIDKEWAEAVRQYRQTPE